ncbi:MAG: FapA family protein [Eubacterium sp.]|nr:FapA family protein [Eubacterium sp.]
MAPDEKVLDGDTELAEAEENITPRQVNNVEVRVSRDKMSAYVMLARAQGPITVDDVVFALNAAGVVYGISEANIRKVISQEGFLEPVPVAIGTEPVPSIPGKFTYHFEKEVNGKPQVLADGSVDYLNVNAISIVEKDDVIAEYSPAVQGTDGYNVLGQSILVKRVPELPPLRGKGFTRSEDGRTYTANITGKVNEENGRIVISAVYELPTDASIATGNIDFRGDVVIHGAVRDGITIKATGSITVDDIVEGAQLEAGGDIVLKQGLMGNSKAIIRCDGNLTAKFVEFCYVEARGDIHAESFMECEIYCYGRIVLDGRKSKIIGGSTVAIGGIVAEFIGNAAGVSTFVKAGADAELKFQLISLKKKMEATQNSIKRVEEGLDIISRMERLGQGDPEENKANRMQLMRVKIRDSSILSADRIEMDRIEHLITAGQGVDIMVRNTVFAGTHVKIGDATYLVKSDDYRLSFVEEEDGIKVLRY